MAFENPYQPFEVLEFIAAPALLTNACSLLVLSTSNRFARAVDRERQLEREGGPDEDILRVQRRAKMLSNALVAFYVAVSVFALGTFIELLGAGIASIGGVRIAPWITVLGICASTIGILAIAGGAALLSIEATVAYRGLVVEHARRPGPDDRK
jgi:hypothetical protein